ncbi:MAG: HAMP domain-containing histidine kinase [Bdellovibrionales bacterium]|nr:HAMP domain-containing histidine kinase [Bdellovibrionales bacterium]
MALRERLRKLDLRAKISLALIAVLLPVFGLLAFSAHLFIRPSLLREIEQIGISAGKTLATEIVVQKLLTHQDREHLIESRVREFLYLQPNIRRIEVFARDPKSGKNLLVASSIEEDPEDVRFEAPDVTRISTELMEEPGTPERGFEVWVPIMSGAPGIELRRDAKNPADAKNDVRLSEPKPVGAVRVVVSIALVSRLARLSSNVAMVGGSIGLVLLFFLLNGALRATIENDRKLREAEKENLVLTSQLHEVERNLLNLEKFAVLGQLTATFAHEIGTPLNAIGGHLALLKEEAAPKLPQAGDRIGIIEGQVAKIAGIVRGFLQNTSKPVSQKQLVDPHQIVEKTLSIVRPRVESLGVEIERDFDRSLGPIRIVPVDFEQVLLNLVNNSLDSIRMKNAPGGARRLKLTTRGKKVGASEGLELRIRDTGEGIESDDLERVFQPFFTTKGPGEGTGLGLSICRDLLKKYGGSLGIDSKRGDWTEVVIDIPYRNGREGA